ncbi:MAG: hypothetical protein FJZ01_02030 [Candidatus Sericytochromatia bacterium]|nr:hypothetical protein [Candidatus Tanganyikabacteria bacterium]
MTGLKNGRSLRTISGSHATGRRSSFQHTMPAPATPSFQDLLAGALSERDRLIAAFGGDVDWAALHRGRMDGEGAERWEALRDCPCIWDLWLRYSGAAEDFLRGCWVWDAPLDDEGAAQLASEVFARLIRYLPSFSRSSGDALANWLRRPHAVQVFQSYLTKCGATAKTHTNAAGAVVETRQARVEPHSTVPGDLAGDHASGYRSEFGSLPDAGEEAEDEKARQELLWLQSRELVWLLEAWDARPQTYYPRIWELYLDGLAGQEKVTDAAIGAALAAGVGRAGPDGKIQPFSQTFVNHRRLRVIEFLRFLLHEGRQIAARGIDHRDIWLWAWQFRAGFSIAAVADDLNLPETEVRHRLERIRERVRQAWIASHRYGEWKYD